MVHELGDAVERRPSRALDAREVITATVFEEARHLVHDVLSAGRSLTAVLRKKPDGLVVGLEAFHGDLNLRQRLSLAFELVEALVYDAQALADIGHAQTHGAGVANLLLAASQADGDVEGILADDPLRAEHDVSRGRAVVGVGQEQVLLAHIVARDPNDAWELGQEPDALPKAQGPSGVVDGQLLAHDGVKEAERFLVLEGAVDLANHAQGHIGVGADGRIVPFDAGAVLKEQGLFLNLEVEARRDDGLSGSSGPLELSAQSVPRFLARVEHARLARRLPDVVAHFSFPLASLNLTYLTSIAEKLQFVKALF